MIVACYNEFTFQSRSSRDEGISKSTFKYRKVTQFTAQIRKSIARIRKTIAQSRKSSMPDLTVNPRRIRIAFVESISFSNERR